VLSEIAHKIEPSVVLVFGESAIQGAQTVAKQDPASGVIVDAKGYILTNRHVIEKADNIRVKVWNDAPQVTHDAKVIGMDAETDLALIKIDTDVPLTAATLGNSDSVQLGDWLLPVGFHPATDIRPCIVSGKGYVVLPSSPVTSIRVDASINPQMSGAPVVDMQGRVVGIGDGVLGASALGVGYVLPTNSVVFAYNQLIGPEHRVVRGTIGIMFNADDTINPGDGLLLTDVLPGGPADQAGLKKGDILLSINGKTIRTKSDFFDVMPYQRPGSRVSILFRRIGANRSSEDSLPTPLSTLNHPQSGIRPTHVEGFWNSIGLQPGDEILEVNKHPVTSEQEFQNVVNSLANGRDLVLLVRSATGGSDTHFLAGTLDVDPQTVLAQINFATAEGYPAPTIHRLTNADGTLETEVFVADRARVYASHQDVDGPPQCNSLNQVVQVDDDEPNGPGYCASEADYWFTNISAEPIDCAIIFHKNGRYDPASVLTFLLRPGEKSGGPGKISSCGADKMQYQCFAHAENAASNSCTARVQWQQ
jgi:S1-C subfamily serine protease